MPLDEEMWVILGINIISQERDKGLYLVSKDMIGRCGYGGRAYKNKYVIVHWQGNRE